MPALRLTDAEQLKTMVVDPVIAALRTEMRDAVQPLVTDLAAVHQNQTLHQNRLADLESRVTAVERFKLRIAAVCSAIAVLTGVVWRMTLDWIRGHLPRSR